MNDKIWSRFAPRAPQVSWFEFLLDRTGKLLKDHVKGSNPGEFNYGEKSCVKCKVQLVVVRYGRVTRLGPKLIVDS